jgi:hypothetical protein
MLKKDLLEKFPKDVLSLAIHGRYRLYVKKDESLLLIEKGDNVCGCGHWGRPSDKVFLSDNNYKFDKESLRSEIDWNEWDQLSIFDLDFLIKDPSFLLFKPNSN